jgi:hypothetical protein
MAGLATACNFNPDADRQGRAFSLAAGWRPPDRDRMVQKHDRSVNASFTMIPAGNRPFRPTVSVVFRRFP